MKLIAHRGNMNGPNPELENTPDYILKAITLGFDCEIDIRYINDKLYLGHDLPQCVISLDFLLNNKDKLWIHCKNVEALDFLHNYEDLNIFFHDKDEYTITSKNFIWSYIGVKTTKNIICVMPELVTNDLNNFFKENNKYCAVCTDHCSFLNQQYKTNITVILR